VYNILRLICLWTIWISCTCAQAQWYQAPALRYASNYSGVLGEVEERMPAQHIYRDTDKITHVHETTHGLNSRLRVKYGGNCAYIVNTGGLFIMLQEPSVTLTQIAARVPSQLRDNIYQLYLVEQCQHWNEQPLYVLDEFSSYYNGTVYGIEKYNPKVGNARRVQSSITGTLKFLYYSLILVELAPQEPQLQKVVDCLGRHTQACIVQPACDKGLFGTEQHGLWKLCCDKARNAPLK